MTRTSSNRSWKMALGSAALRVGTAFALGLGAASAHADDVTVPISIQVELLGKVAGYETTYAAGKTAEAVVLVVVSDNTDSTRAAGQFEAGINKVNKVIGRRPVRVIRHTYSSAAALRTAVNDNHVAIAYITPTHSGQIGAIAKALAGASIMTVSAVDSDAKAGIVLSFKLEGAKPKFVLNARQARLQNVAFPQQVVNLATVLK